MFILIFILYFVGTLYLVIRCWQALEMFPLVRPYATILLVVIALSYLAVRFIKNTDNIVISGFIEGIERIWLVPMLYLTIIALSIDVLRIIKWSISYNPSFLRAIYVPLKFWIAVGSIVIVSIICYMGNRRFRNPSITETTLSLPASNDGLSSMKMLLISDLHIGSTTKAPRLRQYIDKINQLNPDIICIAGDMFDIGVGDILMQKTSEALSTLNPKYGIYVVPGNHDRFISARKFAEFFNNSSITLLADSAVNIASTFQLLGREDRGRRNRKSLSDLLIKYPTELPVIVLDHQPTDLSEAEQNNVALQLSGHTHDGQIWPMSVLVRSMYELSSGYLKKGNTQYYVSSGLALWGPPYRIGTHSEYVIINIKFE